MGRDWLYNWVSGGGGGKPSAGRGRMREDGRGGASAGCMCAVFQLFDLHQFHHPLPLNQQNDNNPFNAFLQEESTTSKGVEAPRNSLEIEEPAAMNAASKTLAMKEAKEDLNIPVGIQIKTRGSKSRTEDFLASSECSSSISPGGAKTPSLVARLMGLDLLPERTSPSTTFSSSNSKKSHFKQNHHQKIHTNMISQNRSSSPSSSSRRFFDDDISVGARSLPDTPRISSSRVSDVEYHRLSLQINKENNNMNDEFAVSAKVVGRRGTSRGIFRLDENNRSPKYYAKQILNQVRESVSKRVGLIDITNNNRDKAEEMIIRRDQNLVLRHKPTGNKNKQEGTKSTSPRTSTSSDDNQAMNIIQENRQQKDDAKRVVSRIASSSSIKKSIAPEVSENAIRMKKKKKKEEPFVLRSFATNKAKSKKGPLSSNEIIINASGPNVILPVKKGPSPPPTKLPQKQVSDALSSKRNTQLSRNTSHSYKHQLHLRQPHQISTVPGNVLPDNTNGCATTAFAASTAPAEIKNYIIKILKRTGINDKVTPLTLGKWNTPSHPLDPSVFYYLELFHPTAASTVLSRRCNRKLIFQLVDELLAEILRLHLDFKPWVSPITAAWCDDRFGLVDEICKRVESFPAANCEVLEDIDSLIDNDLCRWRLDGFFEDEGESLVCEIEGEIMELLVRETVAMVGVPCTDGGGNAIMSRAGLHVTRCR